MKKQLTAKELIAYLDKKSSELEGDSILQQMNRVDTNANLSTAEILNKMYEFGYERGKIIGKRDILIEIALMIKLDDNI
jgi:hypothetical protein